MLMSVFVGFKLRTLLAIGLRYFCVSVLKLFFFFLSGLMGHPS